MRWPWSKARSQGGSQGGSLSTPVGQAPKERNKRTVAQRRNYRRILAGVFVALFVLALPIAAVTGFMGYRFFVSGSQATAQTADASLGSREAQAVDDLDRLDAARTLAVEFSGEYLTLDPEEDPDLSEQRIGGFLDPAMDPENIVPAPPEGVRQSVLASLPVYTRPVDGNSFEIRTRNRILREPLNSGSGSGSGSGSADNKDEGSASDGKASGAEDSDESTPAPEVQVMAVYVGVDDEGRAAIVDPPTLLKGSGRYAGQGGALDFPDGAAPDELNPDGQLATRIDGYLAALYGRSESQRNLERFFVPGAKIPQPPSPELNFIEVSKAVLKPRLDDEGEFVAQEAEPEAAGQKLLGVYDVELWVAARVESGPSRGMVVNQTHLLKAGYTEDKEWLLLGER